MFHPLQEHVKSSNLSRFVFRFHPIFDFMTDPQQRLTAVVGSVYRDITILHRQIDAGFLMIFSHR